MVVFFKEGPTFQISLNAEKSHGPDTSSDLDGWMHPRSGTLRVYAIRVFCKCSALFSKMVFPDCLGWVTVTAGKDRGISSNTGCILRSNIIRPTFVKLGVTAPIWHHFCGCQAICSISSEYLAACCKDESREEQKGFNMSTSGQRMIIITPTNAKSPPIISNLSRAI